MEQTITSSYHCTTEDLLQVMQKLRSERKKTKTLEQQLLELKKHAPVQTVEKPVEDALPEDFIIEQAIPLPQILKDTVKELTARSQVLSYTVAPPPPEKKTDDAEVTTLTEQLLALEKENKRLTTALQAAHSSKQENTVQESTVHERLEAQLEDQKLIVKDLTASKKDALTKLEAITREAAQAERTIQEQNTTIQRLQVLEKEYSVVKAALEQTLYDTRHEKEALAFTLHAKEETITELHTAVTTLEALEKEHAVEIHELEGHLARRIQECTLLAKSEEETQNALFTAQKEGAVKDQTIEALHTECTAAKSAIEAAARSYEEQRELHATESERLHEEIRAYAARLEELGSELQILQGIAHKYAAIQQLCNEKQEHPQVTAQKPIPREPIPRLHKLATGQAHIKYE